MPDTIIKLISFIEEKIKETEKMINLLLLHENVVSFQIGENTYSISSLNKQKDNLKKVISFLKKEEKYGTLYKYYDYISEILEISDFTDNEKLEALMYVIKTNLAYLSDAVLDLNVFKKLYAPQMDSEKFNRFLEKLNINALLRAKEETLTPKELLIKEKIIEALRIGEKNTKQFKKAHNFIYDHYLNKCTSYDEKDIQFVGVGLKAIGVDENLREMVVRILEKELQKRNARTLNIKRQESHVTSPIVPKEPAEKPLTEKEYNEIYKTIMKMYDIEEHKIVAPLTKEQTIYLVSLMFRIKIPEKEIRKSIQNINWQGWKAYQNMVEEFNAYQEKMERNSHITEVVVIRKNIQDYMEGLVAEDQKERLFWQNEIEEELKRLRKILNQDDTYELEEGRKLYRNRLKGEENDGSSK